MTVAGRSPERECVHRLDDLGASGERRHRRPRRDRAAWQPEQAAAPGGASAPLKERRSGMDIIAPAMTRLAFMLDDPL